MPSAQAEAPFLEELRIKLIAPAVFDGHRYDQRKVPHKVHEIMTALAYSVRLHATHRQPLKASRLKYQPGRQDPSCWKLSHA